ncbi:ead/Ea22-like family protein [Serratia bockelmannii]|uniref:ead/Ea22-like family protein n=1 Tax=Serratia bockelmannii TaxID=2703793 RepID=UPI00313F2860
MDKFSELKAAAMAATPGPWSINRTGNTIVSNHSHPVATVSDAFHRQLAGGGVGKDAEFIAAANPAAVLALLAERDSNQQNYQNAMEELRIERSQRQAADQRLAELEAEITNIVDSHAETVAELRAKLEAKDKRIAELESIRADASQVFKEIGNELGCNPDNESIMMAIDDLKEREKRVVALAGGNADLWETMAARLEAAEAKLATPVRLPTTSGRLGVAYTRVIPEVIEAIRAAGFTVEDRQ